MRSPSQRMSRAETFRPSVHFTEWIFETAIDTLKLVEQWDVRDFQDVLDRLEVDRYYLFEGELKRRRSSQEC
jgi:hypothetical protein